MEGAVRAEVLKLSKRPAIWVVLAVLVTTLVLFSYVLPYLVSTVMVTEDGVPQGTGVQRYELSVESLLPSGFVAMAVNGAGGFGVALALILGVLAVGSEYRWRTLKTIATQGPSRLALGGSKLTVLVGVALLFAAAYLVLSLLCSLLVAGLEGTPVDLPAPGSIVAGLGASWLILSMWAAFGAFLAVALRGTGLAIGLGLVYQLLVESLLTAAVPWPEQIATVLRAALPGLNTAALLRHFADLPGWRIPTVHPGQAAGVLAGYLALFVLLSGLFFRRRDIL